MPTLQDRLEDATAQVEADGRKLHDIVHGSSSTEVETEGGTVKSCAKAIADMEAEWNAPNGVAKARAILDEIKTKLKEAAQNLAESLALKTDLSQARDVMNSLREELAPIPATVQQEGVIQLASQDEANAGTSDSLAVTPKTLSEVRKGSVVQFAHALSNQRYMFNMNGRYEIPGLSITIKPKSANNLLLLRAVVSHTYNHVMSFGFMRGDSVLEPPTRGTNRNDAHGFVTLYSHRDNNLMTSTSFQAVVPVTSTYSQTYQVWTRANWVGETYSFYINNRHLNEMAAVSTFTIEEIAQ